jgi:hypothetical protein
MDVASGVTIGSCYRRHRQQEFLRFLNEIDLNLPAGFDRRMPPQVHGVNNASSITVEGCF